MIVNPFLSQLTRGPLWSGPMAGAFMKKTLLFLVVGLSLPWAALAAEPAGPQTAAATAAPPPSASAQRSAAELEKLAQPIALHPDPLISILLPAAAYPVEIVQAARFIKDTNNIPKLDQQPWDENVKAVARFPALIGQMDADLDWTIALGQAFVDQPKELMDTIQALRAKAHKAGTLQSSPQQVVTVTNVVVIQTNVTQVVTVTNQVVQVQPANPQVVYVPSYPPTVYYPPPAYVYDPLAPLVTFGVGMAVGAIIANNCDWHGGCVWVGGGGVWVGGSGDIDIDIDHNVNIDRGERPPQQGGNRAANTAAKPAQQKWQPDQGRLRSSGAPASAQSREARGWSGASPQPSNLAASAGAARPAAAPAARPAAAGQPAARPASTAQPSRPASGNVWSAPAAQPRTPAAGTGSTWQQPASRPAASPAARPAASSGVSRPSPQPSTAFSGVSSGSGARASSARGAASRSGGARGGGRGR